MRYKIMKRLNYHWSSKLKKLSDKRRRRRNMSENVQKYKKPEKPCTVETRINFIVYIDF